MKFSILWGTCPLVHTWIEGVHFFANLRGGGYHFYKFFNEKMTFFTEMPALTSNPPIVLPIEQSLIFQKICFNFTLPKFVILNKNFQQQKISHVMLFLA